mmetsp:Transcript_46244/g.77095  ORF Transcript_46244/g.77095 Transcript_46244/m.77095 type:complete len:209 (+) Transcript_46244:370-996(+)
MRKQLLRLPFFLFVKSSMRVTASTKSPPMFLTTSQRSFSMLASASLSQNDTSFRQGGNLLNDANFCALPPCLKHPALNWEVKRSSSVQKRRMSGMSNRTMARRSRPRPKAHALLSPRSAPSRMACCITPHPSTSSHSPLKKISSSKDGSVKGKYASTHRISTSPNRCCASPLSARFSSFSASSVPVQPAASHSAFSNTRTPSIWWKAG